MTACLDRKLDAAKHTSPGLVRAEHFEAPPAGYRFGRTKQVVGSGLVDFERARSALRDWSFLPDWARVYPERAAQDPGACVLMVVRTFGMWAALPARILSRIDDVERERRCAGFVYAALPRHVAEGYERFVVEHDTTSDTVTFELAAVARPVHPLLRLAPPVFRVIQRRFRRACMHRMRRQVASWSPLEQP